MAKNTVFITEIDNLHGQTWLVQEPGTGISEEFPDKDQALFFAKGAAATLEKVHGNTWTIDLGRE